MKNKYNRGEEVFYEGKEYIIMNYCIIQLANGNQKYKYNINVKYCYSIYKEPENYTKGIYDVPEEKLYQTPLMLAAKRYKHNENNNN